MGVRGLQTFIETQCPDACKKVSLKEKANEHQRKFNCRPELVVDGLCLTSQLYKKSGLEWIYGGQYFQFMNLITELVTKFKDAGIELVFFFDGTVDPLKHEEWVKRRISRYREIATIFSDVKANFKVTDNKAFFLPPLWISFYMKELGVKVYQTDREADDEIIEYAEKNKNVFGILSQDSDFIICNTKEYFSLLHLDLESLHTIHYDRHCLARNYLDLELNQLPLFACLAGNYIVNFEKLRRFHQRLLNKKFVYLTALAPVLSRLIKISNWTGNIHNFQELNQVSSYVFGDESGVKLLQDGLKSYAVGQSSPTSLKIMIEVPQDLEKEIHKRHIDCCVTPYIFDLLYKQSYYCSEDLEDVTVTPSSLVYREVRQRCYGILFNISKTRFLPNGKLIVIEEYCGYHGNQLEKPELVEPLPLKKLITGGAPTLNDIMYSLSQSEKLKLFWTVWELPMDFTIMEKIPKNLLVFSCIINFLIGGSSSGPHLKPFDVAVFVAQAVLEKNTSLLHHLQVPWVDDEAINLATLFMLGVSNTAPLVLGICDNPIPITYAMPWHFFDGKLFHYLYTTSKKICSVRELCQNQPTAIELFYYLLQVVTNNTKYAFENFDWKTTLKDFEG